MIHRYREFCQIHSLKQLIKCPTHVICNTSTLIGHILITSTKKIFQSSVIDSGISDHQLIFCTRKVKQVKFHKHNNASNAFSNMDAAYKDFLNKLMKVINEIAPSKEIRIKNNNQDWFDREVADLIHVWGKIVFKV